MDLTKGEKILCVFMVLLLIGLGLAEKTIMDLKSEISSLKNDLESKTEGLFEVMGHCNLTIVLWFKPSNFSRLEIYNVTLRVLYEPINQSLVFDLGKQKTILYQDSNKTMLFSVSVPSYWLKSVTDSGTASIGVFPTCYISYQEIYWLPLTSENTSGNNILLQGSMGLGSSGSSGIYMGASNVVWYVEV